MRKLLFTLLLFFNGLFTFSQESKIIDLKKRLSKEENIIKKLEILDDLTSKLYNINIDEYKLYIDSMSVIAISIDNKAYIAQSLLSKGLYQSKISNNQEALKLMKESLKQYKNIDSLKEYRM